jgi:hypothetical protein
VLRLGLRCISLLMLLFVAGSALAQSEFSGEIYNDSAKGAKGPTKVYFGKDKMRFDTNDAQGGGVIVDFSTQSYLVIMPKQHMYMQMPAQAMESRGLFNFFKSGDIDNACSDWLKLATNSGGTCHKVGSETVNGRSTVEYEGTNTKGDSSKVWLDKEVRFPIKWEGRNGGGELRNIQEGSQPASLFDVPAGYTKMDMGGMMQQHH